MYYYSNLTGYSPICNATKLDMGQTIFILDALHVYNYLNSIFGRFFTILISHLHFSITFFTYTI